MHRVLTSLVLILALPTVILAADFDFSAYAAILEKNLHVDQRINHIPTNTLDYRRMAKEQNAEDSAWHKLIAALAAFDPATIENRNARMAFWINVYNIAAIKTILDHWPVNSIKNRSINWLGSPWKRKAITIGGRDYSLHEIEFDVLIEGFHDLRVHLGINCASTSCLDLIAAPYSGAKLDGQLQRQGERLASQPEKGLLIDRENKLVYVSKIFAFDEEHFNAWAGGPIAFLLPYVTDPGDRSFLEAGHFRLRFLDYDWTLNDTRFATPP